MTNKLSGWVELKNIDGKVNYYRTGQIQVVYETATYDTVGIELIGDSDECVRYVQGPLLDVMKAIWSVECQTSPN